MYRCNDQCIDVTMYRKPCIDVTQFCNDLCIGHIISLWYAIHLSRYGARRYMPNLLVLLYHYYLNKKLVNRVLGKRPWPYETEISVRKKIDFFDLNHGTEISVWKNFFFQKFNFSVPLRLLKLRKLIISIPGLA
jgi:hypothetical protein